MMGNDERDRLSMEALRQGNDSGLSELMERHQENLFRFAFRLLQNETDAGDVAQETFVKVYLNRSKFDLAQRFSTWLYQIASNLVKDRFRWRSRHPETTLPPSGGEISDPEELVEDKITPASAALSGESSRVVAEAISLLPPDLRIPLVLSHYEGKSHADIAAILGCSSKAVETRIYRAKKQLRYSLASYLSEPIKTS